MKDSIKLTLLLTVPIFVGLVLCMGFLKAKETNPELVRKVARPGDVDWSKCSSSFIKTDCNPNGCVYQLRLECK